MLYERTEQGLRRFQGNLLEDAAGALERADEDSIVAALGDGRFADEYLYCLHADGKDLVGISTGGAFEMARLLGCVEVLPEVNTDRDEAGYHVVVRVRDNLRQVTLLGAARQPFRKQAPLAGRPGHETGETDEKPDSNAWVVAVNKAQRNGILRLVSAEARRRIIGQFLARGQKEAPGETGSDRHQIRSEEKDKGVNAGHSNFPEHGPDSAPPSLSAADFAAGCRQKGYRTSAEVCSALGLPDKRALVRFGLARVMEKLPDLPVDSQDSPDEAGLGDVDLGF